MGGLTLLERARAAGLIVVADGETLRVRGPRKAAGLARELIAHKAEVLEELSGTCRRPGSVETDPTFEGPGMPVLRDLGAGLLETDQGRRVRFTQFTYMGCGKWITPSDQTVLVVSGSSPAWGAAGASASEPWRSSEGGRRA